MADLYQVICLILLPLKLFMIIFKSNITKIINLTKIGFKFIYLSFIIFMKYLFLFYSLYFIVFIQNLKHYLFLLLNNLLIISNIY